MTKQIFLDELKKHLKALCDEDVEQRLAFYSEMIDDRIEAGLTEDAAVADIGSPAEVAKQIIEETSILKLIKAKKRKRSGLSVTEKLIMLPGLLLAICALAVTVLLYAVLWAVILSFWSALIVIALTAILGIPYSVVLAIIGEGASVLAILGISAVCLGLSVFAFYGCLLATRGAVKLTKLCINKIKKALVKEAL